MSHLNDIFSFILMFIFTNFIFNTGITLSKRNFINFFIIVDYLQS